MERYYKIGELSKLYGIGTDTIRYYESLGLIHPTRGENGYRMYSIKDIWRMNVIRDLRSLGFSMERISGYLRDRSVKGTIGLLEEEQAAIHRRMARLRQLNTNVTSRLAALKEALEKPVGVVQRAAYPARRCHEIAQPFTTDEEMDLLLKQLLNRLGDTQYIIGNPQIGTRMSKAAVEKGDYHRYDSVFIIEPGSKTAEGLIDAGDFLTVYYTGSSKRGDIYVPMLFDHARAEGLTLTGEVLEFILVDIHGASDYNEHLTELQARIAPGKGGTP